MLARGEIKTKVEVHVNVKVHVKEKKFSILNSILVLIVLIVIIICFWFLKNSGLNFFVLINFFLQEFYFNLNMIISDLTKIIHHLLN